MGKILHVQLVPFFLYEDLLYLEGVGGGGTLYE